MTSIRKSAVQKNSGREKWEMKPQHPLGKWLNLLLKRFFLSKLRPLDSVLNGFLQCAERKWL